MVWETGGQAPWWTLPPAHRVSYLLGADPELLAIDLDPLPPDGPAVIRFHPGAEPPSRGWASALLDELERAAVALFPHWLPGAEKISGTHPLGIRALRALATEAAAHYHCFGPFLADLAERAFRETAGDSISQRQRFPDQVRAANLARVIARSYNRENLVVLVDVPENLSGADEQALVASAEWLAEHGRLSVWLAGPPLKVVDRVAVTLPIRLTRPVPNESATTAEAGAAPRARQPQQGPKVICPPLSGQPRRDSRSEMALERALAQHEWARGRHWNYTYEWDALRERYRLDVFWPAERVVVEIDGPEHREPVRFAADRRRDAQLQLLGHTVLRFTDEQVLTEIHNVLASIERALAQRRK